MSSLHPVVRCLSAGPHGERRHALDPWLQAVVARLRQAVADRSYRQIADDTDTHPETVRRYLTDGTPCARFIAAVCRAYGVSADWVLLGSEGAGRAPPETVRASIIADVLVEDGRLRVLGVSCADGVEADDDATERGRSSARAGSPVPPTERLTAATPAASSPLEPTPATPGSPPLGRVPPAPPRSPRRSSRP